jgi:fructose-1,6-bisphosphatase/inositol monophosphatase family enzyme
MESMNRNMTPAAILAQAVSAVQAEGARLREEFYAPHGPRGRRGSCPIDREIEERLQPALQALFPAQFCGEECADKPGSAPGWVWLVDPHDGTFEYTSGRRGSSISVALVREGVPVLGIVHAPDSPDRGPDTIAWAEGAGPIVRNGKPVQARLTTRVLEPGAFVWATASSAFKPETWSRAVKPARYIAMPSIAYRMARVAAGDGVATVSTHSLNEYDIAAGMALIAAAGGVCLDREGREIRLEGSSTRRVSGCFAGAPHAARALATFDWPSLDAEPRREARLVFSFPRKPSDDRLSRAQAVLLGHVIGDSLGALVERKPAAEIARLYPEGVRELADGGVYKTLAGQSTDDSEMALTLARLLVREKKYEAAKALDAYRAWLTSRPVDVAMTNERGLLGTAAPESESNGSLMRVAPIGVWAAGDPALAARTARGRACPFEGSGARGDQARGQGPRARRLFHPPELGRRRVAERLLLPQGALPRRGARAHCRLRRRHGHQRRGHRRAAGRVPRPRPGAGAVDPAGAGLPPARRVRRAAPAADRILARRHSGARRSASALTLHSETRAPQARKSSSVITGLITQAGGERSSLGE